MWTRSPISDLYLYAVVLRSNWNTFIQILRYLAHAKWISMDAFTKTKSSSVSWVPFFSSDACNIYGFTSIILWIHDRIVIKTTNIQIYVMAWRNGLCELAYVHKSQTNKFTRGKKPTKTKSHHITIVRCHVCVCLFQPTHQYIRLALSLRLNPQTNHLHAHESIWQFHNLKRFNSLFMESIINYGLSNRPAGLKS